MNPWSVCDEKNPQREWTYPLIFSLGLHLLIFLLAVLPITLLPRRDHLTPVYSVRLVGAPLPARYPIQSKSVSAKDTGIEAAGKKVVNKKILTNEKLSQQYEEKIKSLTTFAPLPENEPQPGLGEEKVPSYPSLTAPAGDQTGPGPFQGDDRGYNGGLGSPFVGKIGNTDSTVSKQNILDGYLTTIRTMLERNKEYPLGARRNSWEGTVKLRFVVSRRGTIEDINVIGSSGFSILDEAAERTVRRIGKFPSIPKELTMNRLSLDVPLVFKLVNR